MNTQTISDCAITGAVRTWLQTEGLSVFVLSTLLYRHSGSGWWMFVGLLLTPDLSMLGYLRNPRVGAISYNIVHSYLLPLSLAAVAIVVNRIAMLPFLCIWTAHIGIDRFLGYGLKYSAAFGRTHLGTLRNGPEKRVAVPAQ